MLMAGVSFGHHDWRRQWAETRPRTLAWREARKPVEALDAPLPGTAPLLAFDAWDETALLADGSTWTWDGAAWCRGDNAWEDGVKDAKLVAAGAISGQPGAFWLVGSDRRVWTYSPTAGRVNLAKGPVPGTGRILALDAGQRVVILEDGIRYETAGGEWHRIGGVADADGTFTVRARMAFTLAGGRSTAVGEELTLPEKEARRLIAGGLVEPA